jgi:hypothetical protein
MKKAPFPQEQKSKAPKYPGIATNFDSIKDYLRKLVNYLKSKDLSIQSNKNT